MADEEKEETKDGAEKKDEESGGSKVGAILGIVLPGLLAAGGAFGGAMFAGGNAPAEAAPEQVVEQRLPGPTVPLNPFVLNVQDKDGGSHPAKMTFAIELAKDSDPQAFEVFVPRIRDTVLTYLRSMSFEEISDGKSKVKMTEDLIAAIHKLGAEEAKQILVQDFVIQ